MHSQLNYTIAKQHHTELIQAAEHTRLASEVRTRRNNQPYSTAYSNLRERITVAIAHSMRRTSRDAL